MGRLFFCLRSRVLLENNHFRLEVTDFITHSFEMKKLFICLIFYSIMLGVQAEDRNQFRGPTGQGHSVAKGLPLTWNRTSGVAWQVNLDGKAWSSPISINNQIILTNALLVEGHLSLEVLRVILLLLLCPSLL